MEGGCQRRRELAIVKNIDQYPGFFKLADRFMKIQNFSSQSVYQPHDAQTTGNDLSILAKIKSLLQPIKNFFSLVGTYVKNFFQFLASLFLGSKFANGRPSEKDVAKAVKTVRSAKLAAIDKEKKKDATQKELKAQAERKSEEARKTAEKEAAEKRKQDEEEREKNSFTNQAIGFAKDHAGDIAMVGVSVCINAISGGIGAPAGKIIIGTGVGALKGLVSGAGAAISRPDADGRPQVVHELDSLGTALQQLSEEKISTSSDPKQTASSQEPAKEKQKKKPLPEQKRSDVHTRSQDKKIGTP
jgi:hypothetical protein